MYVGILSHAYIHVYAYVCMCLYMLYIHKQTPYQGEHSDHGPLDLSIYYVSQSL
jgi:hypothetical protein